jgi:hypothetical protein
MMRKDKRKRALQGLLIAGDGFKYRFREQKFHFLKLFKNAERGV